MKNFTFLKFVSFFMAVMLVFTAFEPLTLAAKNDENDLTIASLGENPTLEDLGVKLNYTLSESDADENQRNLSIQTEVTTKSAITATTVSAIVASVHVDNNELTENAEGTYSVRNGDVLSIIVEYTDGIDPSAINKAAPESYTVIFSDENTDISLTSNTGDISLSFYLGYYCDIEPLDENSRYLHMDVEIVNSDVVKKITEIDVYPDDTMSSGAYNPTDESVLENGGTLKTQVTMGATYDIKITYLDANDVSQIVNFDNRLLVGDELNYVWEENTDNTTVTIKKYNKEAPTDKVIVPSILDGKTVTKIDEGAFKDLNIDVLTFQNSSEIKEIGKEAFANNNISNITLPDSITDIGESAFLNSSNLETLVLPSNLKTLGKTAFFIDTSAGSVSVKLFDVEIPSSLAIISESAFENSGIQNLTFDTDSEGKTALRTIGNRAFVNTYNLTSIILPEGLENINAPTSYTTTRDYGNMYFGAFSITNRSETPDMDIQLDAIPVSIPTTVKNISNGTFNGRNISELKWHNGITDIGADAFRNTDISEFAYIDTSYTYINTNVSEEDKSYRLPEALVNIGHYAFTYTNLPKLIYPFNVNTVTGYGGIDTLEVLVVEEWDISSVKKGAQNLGSIYQSRNAPSEHAFKFTITAKLKEVYLPDNTLVTINDAFHSTTSLETVATYSDYKQIYYNSSAEEATNNKTAILGTIHIPHSVEEIIAASLNGFINNNASNAIKKVYIGDETNKTKIETISPEVFRLDDVELEILRIFESSARNGGKRVDDAPWGANIDYVTYNDSKWVELDTDTDGTKERWRIAIDSNELQYYLTSEQSIVETFINNINSGISDASSKLTVGSQDVEFNIPDKVTVDGSEYTVIALSGTAFKDNDEVTDITIGDSSKIETIEVYTFEDATALKNIAIGGSVKAVEEFAFANTPALVSVNFGANVNYVGASAFANSGVSSIVFAAMDSENPSYHRINNVDYELFIGNSCFSDTKNLKTLDINKEGKIYLGADLFATLSGESTAYNHTLNINIASTESPFIGYAFKDISLVARNNLDIIIDFENLTEYDYLAGLPTSSAKYPWSYGAIGTDGVSSLDLSGFTTKWTDTIPVDIDNDGENDSFFNYSTNSFAKYYGDSTPIENVSIPATFEYKINDTTHLGVVEQISSYAFCSISGLKSINTPVTLKKINDYGFSYMTEVLSVVLHEGLESIGSHAFSRSIPLKSTTLGGSIFVIPTTTKNFGKYLFSNHCKVENLVTPSAPASAFQYSLYLETVEFNNVDPITSIDGYAFADCGLTSIVWPEGLETISYYAFRGNNLKSIILPDGVTSVGGNAFYSGSNVLEQVILPRSIESIGANAFATSNQTSSALISQLFIPSELVNRFDANATIFPSNSFANRNINAILVEEYSSQTDFVSNLGAKNDNVKLLYLGQYLLFSHTVDDEPYDGYTRKFNVSAKTFTTDENPDSIIQSITIPNKVKADGIVTDGLLSGNNIGEEIILDSENISIWGPKPYVLTATNSATSEYIFDFYGKSNDYNVAYNIVYGRIGVPSFTESTETENKNSITLSHEVLNDVASDKEKLREVLIASINPRATTKEYPDADSYVEYGDGTFDISDSHLDSIIDNLISLPDASVVNINVTTTSGTGFTDVLQVQVNKQEIITYTVKFDKNTTKSTTDDESFAIRENINQGSTISLSSEGIVSEVPTREGYEFGDWYDMQDPSPSDFAWDQANDLIVSDLTLYAKWTPMLTFKVDDSTTSLAKAPGEKIELTSEASDLVTDYISDTEKILVGWKVENSNGTLGQFWDFNGSSAMTETPLTLVAVFEDKPHIVLNYDVSFDLNYEAQSGNRTYHTAEDIDENSLISDEKQPDSNPLRDGYEFGGWYKDVAATVPWNFEVDLVTENTTLYAKWIIILNYDVLFDLNYEVQSGNRTYHTAEDIDEDSLISDEKQPDSNPLRDGYEFGGWYKDVAATVPWNFEVDLVTENTTLYAKWILETTDPEDPDEPDVDPDVDPDEPDVDPDEPDVDPDEPVVDPDEPAVDPEEPVVDPDEPVVDPDEPVTDPEEPVVDPEEPVVDPDEPVVDPEEPATDPEEPAVDPEEPVVDPDEPVTDNVETLPTSPTINPDGSLNIIPGEIDSVPDTVLVGGQEIPPTSITVAENGSISINPEVFADLPDGEYEIEIVYDGESYITEVIVENGVPLGNFTLEEETTVGASWSLFDLISTIITILILFLALDKLRKNKNYEDESEVNSERRDFEERELKKVAKAYKKNILVLSIISCVSIILLILTQNFTLPMSIFDKYSIYFALFVVTSTLVSLFSKRKTEYDEEKIDARI